MQERSSRRDFIRKAAAGTTLVVLGGGVWALSSDRETARAQAQSLPDGRPRLPPGQRVIERLEPMGGREGNPSPRDFRLRVHGAVDAPFDLDFRALLALPQVEQEIDVHCVTGWSALAVAWRGVRVRDLAERAKVRPSARHLIFEAAHGYTANVRLDDGLRDDVLVTHELLGRALPRTHGGPVRALVPSLYFWKSAKWLTGLRFSERDEPGYWETRGYHNHADPWTEERYG
jgi:DMSO/TMAO reductase YedYZ molybdopterin-dependent catalytic subunit